MVTQKTDVYGNHSPVYGIQHHLATQLFLELDTTYVHGYLWVWAIRLELLLKYFNYTIFM